MAKKKSIYKRAWGFLGSKKLSVFVFVMAMVYTLILFAFSMLVPPFWVNDISELLPYKFLYLLFFINLIICEIKWIPVVLRRCRKAEIPKAETDLIGFRKAEILGLESGAKLVKLLTRRGYVVEESEFSDLKKSGSKELTSHASKIIHACKGRYSPIGNLIFHSSFLILFLGIIISMLFRFEGKARVTEGYSFAGNRGDYSSLSKAALANYPDLSFLLKKITMRFWDGQLLFTDLRADVEHDGREGSMWLSAQLKTGEANVSIQGVGISPLYILKDKAGREIDSGYVNLNVFVPGSKDSFAIPGYPYNIEVSFYPNHKIIGGMISNTSMDPKNPAYYVSISRSAGIKGMVKVFSGAIRPGDDAYFNGVRLSFPEFKYWGDFRIVKDPGLMFIWISLIMMIVGLTWSLLFFRRKIFIKKSAEHLTVYMSADFFPILFEKKIVSQLIND